MHHILIVDDAPTIRRLLRAMLVTTGYAVLEASSGEEALTSATTELPAAILLDHMLPGMDGVATAEALRANPMTAGIPIILMSAGIRLRDYRDAKLVDGILPKPFNLEAVTASLARVLPQPT